MNTDQKTVFADDKTKTFVTRIYTLLWHYGRYDKLGDGATFLILKDYESVLWGLGNDAIEAACVRYLTENPHREPTPGAIYELAVGAR